MNFMIIHVWYREGNQTRPYLVPTNNHSHDWLRLEGTRQLFNPLYAGGEFFKDLYVCRMKASLSSEEAQELLSLAEELYLKDSTPT